MHYVRGHWAANLLWMGDKSIEVVMKALWHWQWARKSKTGIKRNKIDGWRKKKPIERFVEIAIVCTIFHFDLLIHQRWRRKKKLLDWSWSLTERKCTALVARLCFYDISFIFLILHPNLDEGNDFGLEKPKTYGLCTFVELNLMQTFITYAACFHFYCIPYEGILNHKLTNHKLITSNSKQQSLCKSVAN